jgi:hypothetical protein
MVCQVARTLTIDKAAYLAGLIDGEGTISLSQRHANERRPLVLSISSTQRVTYYLALRQTQGTIRAESPNWQPGLVFVLRSLAEQSKRLEKKVERETLVLASMPGLSLTIVEFAREHGRVTIGAAIKLTGTSRNTLEQHFRALFERRTLNQHGSGRGVWYDLR